MATLPERKRATVGELIGLLAPIPADTPIILLAKHHGSAEWLDGFAYDTETNRVELTGGYVDLDTKYRTGTPASNRLVAETRNLAARREASPAVLAEDLRALAEAVPFDRRTQELLEQAADLLDPEDATCGNTRSHEGHLYVCDLPAGHIDVFHQQAGQITWHEDGTVL